MVVPRSFEPVVRAEPATAMRVELAAILSNSVFRVSPVLGRLLSFLVAETLAGRAGALKSYTVAVDGLGRADDADAASEGYARVQMGRLRKALQFHYAQNAPVEGLCLYLQPGCYRVRMGELARAYPELYRPLSAPPAPPAPSMPAGAPSPARTGRRRHYLAGAAALLVAIAGIGFFVSRTDVTRQVLGGAAPVSPVVALSPIRSAGDARSADLAEAAESILADGLNRTWLVRVESPSAMDGSSAAAADRPSYRLEGDVVARGDARRTIFIRLADARSATLLWSGSVDVDANTPALGDTLAPLMSQLAGPFGILAQDQTRRIGTKFAPGYACALQYVAFTVSRDPASLPRVEACLAKPSPEFRLESTRLAFRALALIEQSGQGSERAGGLEAGKRYAQQAVDAGPQDAYARYANARIAFLQGDCDTGLRQARLAIAANPYDPVVPGVPTASGSTANPMRACR